VCCLPIFGAEVLSLWGLERIDGRLDGREKVIVAEVLEECAPFEIVVNEV